MADPLTALMYAVQVMNFLRLLILKTIKEREETSLDDAYASNSDPPDENGHHCPVIHLEACSKEPPEQTYVTDEPVLMNSLARIPEEKSAEDEADDSPQTSHDNAAVTTMDSTNGLSDNSTHPSAVHTNARRKKTVRSNSKSQRKGRKVKGQSANGASALAEKAKGTTTIVSRIDSKSERVEAWR